MLAYVKYEKLSSLMLFQNAIYYIIFLVALPVKCNRFNYI